jgi:hypothetical protein
MDDLYGSNLKAKREIDPLSCISNGESVDLMAGQNQLVGNVTVDRVDEEGNTDINGDYLKITYNIT